MGSVLVGALFLLPSLFLFLLLLLWLSLLLSLLLLRLGLRLERRYWALLWLVAIATIALPRPDYSMRVLWATVVGLLVVLGFGLVRPFLKRSEVQRSGFVLSRSRDNDGRV